MSYSQLILHLHSCYQWPKALSWRVTKSAERLHALTTEIPEQCANPQGFLQPLLLPRDPAPDAMGCLVAQPGIRSRGLASSQVELADETVSLALGHVRFSLSLPSVIISLN